MKKLTRDDGATLDLVAENIERLREIFPEVFAEGRIDFDALKQALGEAVEDREERYSFTWHGKRRAKQIAQTPSTGTLRPCPEESVNWETTQNIFIEGDNLEVLKLLQKSYHRKVKMIYIDPPYNTGNEFIYPDKWQDNLDTYLRYTGQVDDEGFKLSANAETSGRYHTNWLNMMYPRLKLARNLLRDDGAIFVSIDDHEVQNLRQLMDEVFGSENFAECIVWKKMDSPSRNDEARASSTYHEYLLVYTRSSDGRAIGQMKKESILDAYPLTLSDGRSARRRQLRKNGKNARRADRPTLWYPLTAPDGSEVWPVAPEGWEGRWVHKLETWKQREAVGLTEWIKRDYGWVPYYLEIAPDDPSIPWPSLWDDLSQNRQASSEFTSLMSGTGLSFDNPKPVDLMSRVVQMGAQAGGICMDFFAGSGSLAHGVLRQTCDDGIARRYVLVQLPERREGGDKTIADLAQARLRAVSKALTEESTGNLPESTSNFPVADLGFQAFKLSSSNIKPWDADFDSMDQDLVQAVENIKPDRTEDDVLYELLLKYGLDLAIPTETRDIGGRKVTVIGAGALVVCLADDITLDVVSGIVALKAEFQPEVMRVVFKDAGFKDDVVKTNAAQILKQAGIDDVKSL